MADFQIEPIGGGDWDLSLATRADGSADFVMIGNDDDTWVAEVTQRIVYAVGMWLGESAWDRDAGFPWIEGVFGRQPIDGIAALLYERIVEVEGCDGLAEQPVLILDTTTRRLSISVLAQIGAREVPISVTIQGPTETTT